jgi:hypothetical protein
MISISFIDNRPNKTFSSGFIQYSGDYVIVTEYLSDAGSTKLSHIYPLADIYTIQN